MQKRDIKQIKKEFVASTKVSGRKTNNPVVVAIVGLTGVGNSTIARALKKMMGWSILEKNKIRVKLREEGGGFTPQNTDVIYYTLLGKILRGGGNAILDSDFVEKAKRRKLESFSIRFRAKVLYLHLTCSRDRIIERILRARYNPKTDIFKNVVIALREHLRRLPWHEHWSETNGGQYIPKKLPIKFFAEIDTTSPIKWRKKLRQVAKILEKM